MTEDSKQPITVVSSEIVRPSRIDAYEEWVLEINEGTAQFEGYLGVDIIRPSHRTHPEYVAILRFTDYDALRAWEQSSVRSQFL